MISEKGIMYLFFTLISGSVNKIGNEILFFGESTFFIKYHLMGSINSHLASEFFEIRINLSSQRHS